MVSSNFLFIQYYKIVKRGIYV
ncbi:NUDIX hydrolase, partial [Listeria monocytogenes]|nr:NUDIX hydrolase [Listeria monocytogenes]